MIKSSKAIVSNRCEVTFDFTPQGIINLLNLQTPMYKNLAHYGHFGREDLNPSFEKTDKVNELLNKIK